jgi:hypothetical protein
MHGGAKGSGAPKGNRNGWKHGRYSAEAVAARKREVQARRELRALIRAVTGHEARWRPDAGDRM